MTLLREAVIFLGHALVVPLQGRDCFALGLRLAGEDGTESLHVRTDHRSLLRASPVRLYWRWAFLVASVSVVVLTRIGSMRSVGPFLVFLPAPSACRS